MHATNTLPSAKIPSRLSITAIALCTLALAVSFLRSEPLWAQQGEALREAARQGDLAAVKAALDAGADIEAGDRYSATALYLAARAGHLDVVRFLAEQGADVNAAESFYDSRPLDTALSGGNVEMAKVLLALGGESRESALVSAVRSDDLDLARAVVAAGPIQASTLDRLREQATDQRMKELLASARSRPDPEVAPLSPEQLDRLVGRYEGWSSDNAADARRDGEQLVLIVNGGEPTPIEAIEQGVIGMVESTFRSADGKIEASFWGRFGSVEGIYLSLDGGPPEMLRRSVAEPVAATDRPRRGARSEPERTTVHWPGFRGAHGEGIGDGVDTLVRWNVASGEGVLWKSGVPGLGNSSPVIWGDRVFLTTAVAEGAEQAIRVGDTGSGESVEEEFEHSWRVLAYDKKSGQQLWSTEVGRGVPLTDRHFKATQANSTAVTDGKRLVVVFPTAGLACLDFDGNILWHHDLGGLNASAFMDPDQQWGFASSPILYEGNVILQVDVAKGPVDEGAYLAAWNLETGQPVWRVPRDVAPSFSTPTVLQGPEGDELVVNGSTIHGYDPKTGKELWSLGPNSELVIARPVVGNGVVYVSAGYAPVKPIYAVPAGTRGDLEVTPGQPADELRWSHRVGGAYMPTPLLYRGLLYVVHHNGRMVAYDAETGDALYKSRFSQGGTFTGSPIAVNGKLYVPTEEGQMYVITAGTEYEELGVNEFDEPLMATPAVSEGVLFVRTPSHLYALGR